MEYVTLFGVKILFFPQFKKSTKAQPSIQINCYSLISTLSTTQLSWDNDSTGRVETGNP